MVIDKFIIISATVSNYGSVNKPTVKLVERVPKLKGNEISLRLRLTIPDAVFKRPQLQAEMTVPDSAIPKLSITTEMTKKMEDLIKESIGLPISITLLPHEKEEKEKK